MFYYCVEYAAVIKDKNKTIDKLELEVKKHDEGKAIIYMQILLLQKYHRLNRKT